LPDFDAYAVEHLDACADPESFCNLPDLLAENDD
jgi:hypothetical protein